jgi:integral membrane protein
MKNLLTTNIGRLRLIGVLEGISLLLLVGVAVPAKHLYGNPELVRAIGPVHGLLFLLFIINTLRVGVEQGWRFKTTTWKVLVACIIPFGTFYIDRQLLSKIKPDGSV